MSVLGAHLDQCTSWRCCERLHLTSVHFFLKIFSSFAHFMMHDLQAHLPTLHRVFSSFWPNGIIPLPHPPFSPDLTPSDFSVFPQMKKVLKGKHFAHVEKVKQAKKQKMAEALKSIKIKEFKNCFEQWKKSLSRCIASNREYFESDWSINV